MKFWEGWAWNQHEIKSKIAHDALTGICPELPVQVIFLEGVDDAEDSEHVKRTGKKHVREKEEKQAILFQFGAFSDSHFWWNLQSFWVAQAFLGPESQCTSNRWWITFRFSSPRMLRSPGTCLWPWVEQALRLERLEGDCLPSYIILNHTSMSKCFCSRWGPWELCRNVSCYEHLFNGEC